jgi:hypothetical protein
MDARVWGRLEWLSVNLSMASHLRLASLSRSCRYILSSKLVAQFVWTRYLALAHSASSLALGASDRFAFGRIDVIINNAGYGSIGAFEEMSAEEFEGQINTNFWGVINVTRAVLSLLRKQRSGHIFKIFSIGGRSAFPGLSAYHASKFATTGSGSCIGPRQRHRCGNTIVEPFRKTDECLFPRASLTLPNLMRDRIAQRFRLVTKPNQHCSN